MEDLTTITKFKIKDETYYLKAVWNNIVHLTLVNKDKIWNGTFSDDRMKHFYTNLNVSKEQYLKNVKQALCSQSICDKFLIDFIDDELIWKMVIDNNLKCVHGRVKMMDYSPSGGTEYIVDTVLAMKESAEKNLEAKDGEFKEISVQLQVLIDKFHESKNLKCKMEEDLIQRFMAILNTKKHKIAQMTEFIESIRKETNNGDRISAEVKRSIKSASDSD